MVDDDELVPPLDFTAHILSPSSVKLEWRPHAGASPGDLCGLLEYLTRRL